MLEERFPELEVLRLDADVTSRQGALEAVLDRFARSERAVLVGTQLVAKGHDFPDVRLAAAIDADVGLALADFRAEERTFSLLVQLAGRAGREGTGGRVLLQSWTPESRVVRLAARHAVDEFMDGEVARRATFGYPPHARLVRVLVAAPDVGGARAGARGPRGARPSGPAGRRGARAGGPVPRAPAGARAPARADDRGPPRGPGAARSRARRDAARCGGRTGRPWSTWIRNVADAAIRASFESFRGPLAWGLPRLYDSA